MHLFDVGHLFSDMKKKRLSTVSSHTLTLLNLVFIANFFTQLFYFFIVHSSLFAIAIAHRSFSFSVGRSLPVSSQNLHFWRRSNLLRRSRPVAGSMRQANKHLLQLVQQNH
jgi:hypothetical protein